MTNRKRQSGFTLIEVIIVVAILGIISAIALPSYSQYMLKAERTSAITEALRLAQLQNSHFVQNRGYAGSLQLLGVASSEWKQTESGKYLYRMWGAPSNCRDADVACTGYTLYFLARDSQVRDTDCNVFILTNTGAKSAEKKNGDKNTKECWQ